MLLYLRIQNFALIDDVTLHFDRGFSVLTGETGSGKSIILAATNLILGERADLKIIAPNAKKAVVEAQFAVSESLKPFFEQHELDYDSQTIIRREVLSEGKSRAFINDTPVQLTVLKSLTEQFIQIHSQYNTLELKSKSYQLQLLDVLIGLEQERNIYEKEFQHYSQLLELRLQKAQELAQLQQQQDYNAFMLQELEALRLHDPALETLEQDLDRFQYGEQLQLAYTGVESLLQENGVYDQLYRLKQELEKPRQIDPALQQYYERLSAMLIEIKELARDAASFSALELDVSQQQQLLQWQDQLNMCLLKHRVPNVAELKRVYEELASKVGNLQDLSHELTQLDREIASHRTKVEQLASELHSKRSAGAPGISERLQKILHGLKLPHTTLTFQLNQTAELQLNGYTQIQLLFSANLGHQPVAVEKAASGGELSRLMLALQQMVSEKKALPTIIFDEIDTGVSGDVALKMASLLQEMSKNGQCLAITHLPQVAAKAAHHFKVTKELVDQRMLTSVNLLSMQERRTEIARLMSGEQISDAALQHADNLLAQ
ncbi:MAG: DNA repair protein RecN [Flavobacteriales bacterium]